MKYCNNSDDLRLDVKLMAAVHPKDLDIVPTVFDSYGVLKRLYNGRFPLIQEIIDLALTGHVHMSHLMYTNADIVLHPNFYCEAKTLLQLRTYDAFTSDRITIPKATTMEDFFETTIQGKRFRTERKHPGKDCFVFSKEIWQQMNLGKSFIGTTAFSNEIMIQMTHYAKTFKFFPSFESPLTYHRGNDMKWSKKDFNIHLKRGVVSAVCENGYECYCNETLTDNSHPLKLSYCSGMREKARKIWKLNYQPFGPHNSIKWCREGKEQHPDEFKIQIDTL